MSIGEPHALSHVCKKEARKKEARKKKTWKKKARANVCKKNL